MRANEIHEIRKYIQHHSATRMQDAECLLSPKAHARRMARIFEIAPNPFPQGRENEAIMAIDLSQMRTKAFGELIWC